MQLSPRVRPGWHRFILVGIFLLSLALTGSASAQTEINPTGVVHKVGATGSFVFSPKGLSINVGDTVVWVNTAASTSGIDHTVTSATNAWTSSAPLGPGQTFHVTFSTAGTYNYYCKFHYTIGMKGQIVVH